MAAPVPITSRTRAFLARAFPVRAFLIPALLVTVLLVTVSLVTACGDDARPTGAAWRILIEPCQGNLTTRATGAAVGPDLVATVAHGLEGARSIELHRGPLVIGARIVYLDPDKDIALLRTDDAVAEHLTLLAPSELGPVGILGHDIDDLAVVEPGEITELVDVTLDGEGRRAAARLVADIEPGDSGAAVLDRDGKMVAMVFATARGRDVGWAVSATEVRAAVETVAADTSGPEPLAC